MSSPAKSQAAASSSKTAATKKPFDKKKWRENKYSHKAKMERWQNKRQRSIKHKYVKMLSKASRSSGSSSSNPNLQPLGADDDDGGEEEEAAKERRFGQVDPSAARSGDAAKTTRQKRGAGLRQARLDLERREAVAEKARQREEKRRRQQEREEALKAYHKRKAEKNKVLRQKNRKGQPVMAGRMELLLQKIQSQK